MTTTERGCADLYDDSDHNATLKKISRNTLFLLFGQIVSKVVNFGYFLILARIFSVSEFGAINYALSLLLLAHTIAESGLTRLIIRDVGRNENNFQYYLSLLTPLKLVLCFTAYLGLCGLTWLSHDHERIMPLVLIGGVSLIPLGIGALFNAFLQAKQLMYYSSLSEIVLSIAQAIFGIGILLIKVSPEIIFVSYFFATVIYMLFLVINVYRFAGRLSWLLNFSAMLKLLASALPYAGLGILIALSLRLEIVMLGWFSSSADIGVYSVAAKLPEAAMFFPLMLASSVAPVLAKVHEESGGKLRMTYLWCLRRLVQYMLPITVSIVICADIIVTLLFTKEYQVAVPILQILFLAFPFLSLQMLNSSVLLTSTKPRNTLILYGSTTLIQFSLAMIFIPLWGVLGAGISFFISHILGFLISYHHVKKWFMREGGALISIRSPIFAGLVMSLIILFGRDLPLYWLIPAAISVYCLCLLILPKAQFTSFPNEYPNRT